MSALPGTVWGNRFEVMSRISAGAHGEVFRCRDFLAAGLEVAVKRVSIAAPEARRQVAREVRAGFAVQSDFVCRFYDAWEEGEYLYLAMELIAGESLSALLQRERTLSASRVASIGLHVYRGLEALWQVGLVHRDVKPDNIIVTPGSGVKLVDLGLAREESGSSAPLSPHVGGSSFAGTPRYMSPEVLRSGAFSPAADRYALGCVLYEAVRGESPFPETDLISLLRSKERGVELPLDTPTDQKDLIRWACLLMQSDPLLRPGDTLRDALKEIAQQRELVEAERASSSNLMLIVVRLGVKGCGVIGVALLLALTYQLVVVYEVALWRLSWDELLSAYRNLFWLLFSAD